MARKEYWQTLWDKTDGSDLERMLALLQKYSGYGAPGGTLSAKFFRVSTFRWGNHHGGEVAEAIQEWRETWQQDPVDIPQDQAGRALNYLITCVNEKVGDSLANKNGDLNLIANVIYDNTGKSFTFMQPIEEETQTAKLNS